MIVVDSSVWIALLRDRSGSLLAQLRARVREEIVVGDLIMLEILQGASDEAHAARIERNLRQFDIVPMLDETIAVQAARNYRLLRRLGVTIRVTTDIIIGTFCIERGYGLLHNDRDFTPMAAHLGLRVVP